jgi:multiple sugar transport system substrate-binding protein
VTPKELSKEHAALLRAATDGKLGRRDLMRRGLALGLSAPAIAALVGAYQPPRAAAQGTPEAAAQESPLKGQSIDMTILGIAGWPPSRLGVDLANELFKREWLTSYQLNRLLKRARAAYSDLR